MTFSKRIRIFFIIPTLYSGGAEKVFLLLARRFSREKFDITLILLIPGSGHYYALIPNDIRVVQFSFKSTKSSFFRLFTFLKNERPDVVFSTLTHLNIMLSIIRRVLYSNFLFIARESNTLSSSIKNEKFPFLFKILLKTVYRKLDLIICQSRYMANDLIKNFNISPSKIEVIYNPIDIEQINSAIEGSYQIQRKEGVIELVSIGRLSAQKGFDRLLDIMNLIKDFPCRLTILGDGNLKEELQKKVALLGLSNMVFFEGIQKNPIQYIINSDCLLLASYYEGLPNVVLEAHSCGIPVIAFNSPGGTAEIIQDGINGWLVEDGNFNVFAELIRSKKYLQLDKQKIKKTAVDRFNGDFIIQQYEEIIVKHIKQRSYA
jgi:glycosyltransferase involved in cell wall biosynthesis